MTEVTAGAPTVLTVKKRDLSKKAEFYRKNKMTPGVVYGPAFDATPILAAEKELTALIKKTSAAETLTVDIEGKIVKGLIHDYKHDPLSEKIIHFDLYVPERSHVVTVGVPIRFIGRSPVADKGAIITRNLTEIKIEALPENIPKEFVVNLEAITEPHQSIFVKNIDVSPGVKVLVPPNTPIATAISERPQAPAKAAETPVLVKPDKAGFDQPESQTKS